MSSSEALLLQEVLANQLDSSAKEVYADWLEERGDERGEFLRVQLALGRPPRDHDERMALHVRDRELRRRISVEWIRQLGYAEAPKPLNQLNIPRELLNLLPQATAVNFMATPLLLRHDELIVAMGEESSAAAQAMEGVTGYRVTLLPVQPEEAVDAARTYYAAIPQGGRYTATQPAPEPVSLESSLPHQLLQTMLREALRQGADVLHLEPLLRAFRIRFQCSGRLSEFDTPPPQIGLNLITELKRLAFLDVEERSFPAEGRFVIILDETPLHLRVNTLPTACGESAVVHLEEPANEEAEVPAERP